MERDKKRLRIKIITTLPFPIGMAGSNRIMTYAKGLVENGCAVTVLCMKTTEDYRKVLNPRKSGVIDGIEFKYTSRKTIKPENKFISIFTNIAGVINTCFIFFNEKKEKKTDAIIYYAFATSPAILLYVITRIKKIPFIKEISEFPSVYAKGMSLWERLLFRKVHYQLFDGYLIMTKKLIQYFRNEKRIRRPILHVPMTVDYTRFRIGKDDSVRRKYIAYCGLLNNQKDGVNFLIEAFCLIALEFPDIYLYLIGNASTVEEYNSYVNKITSVGLSERVVFTGQVGKDTIPHLLCNALMLVLARPKSLQAEGGFPTKLGEYLSTGNPVVITKVGEISDYLTDGVNAFLAEPGDTNSLYLKIKSILNDYPHAQKVGHEGQKVAIKNFNYKNQTREIINFIKSLHP